MLRAKQPIIVEEDSDSGSDSPAHVNKNSMQPNSKYNEINQMMGRYQIES